MSGSARRRDQTMSDHSKDTQSRQMLNKVPEVTIYFWVIKVLCTTDRKPIGVRARSGAWSR